MLDSHLLYLLCFVFEHRESLFVNLFKTFVLRKEKTTSYHVTVPDFIPISFRAMMYESTFSLHDVDKYIRIDLPQWYAI